MPSTGDEIQRRQAVQRLTRSIHQVQTAARMVSRHLGGGGVGCRAAEVITPQAACLSPDRAGPREAETEVSPTNDTLLAPHQLGALRQFLPQGVLPTGGLLELVSACPGGGGVWLALWLSRGVSGPLLLVDVQHELYPPALASLGLDLHRTVVVRPRSRGEGLWAFEQALRTPGVGAAWCRGLKWNERIYHRLQRAAEAGGALGLISSPANPRPPLARTAARWLIQPGRASPQEGFIPSRGSPLPSLRLGSGTAWGTEPQSSGRRLQIELLQCRGGTPGAVLDLELCDETGAVSVVSPMATATAAARTA
ncbi:MAG: ImuA family protein [Planctomycetaceae bacterium]|jgi:protein ImuA